MAKMKKVYKLYTYDVWGNEKDGFDVNDVFSSPYTIELPKDATDRQIFEALKNVGYLKRGLHLSSIEFDGDEDCLYFNDARNQKPEGELRLVETKNRFRVLKENNSYYIEDQETGNTKSLGDCKDMLKTQSGKSVKTGTHHFIRLAEKSLNENPEATEAKYFGGDK